MEHKTFIVEDNGAGMRIDKFLAEQDDTLTRSAVVRLIEEQQVTVNGAVPSKNARLKTGDTVILSVPEPVPPEAKPENIPWDIVRQMDTVEVIRYGGKKLLGPEVFDQLCKIVINHSKPLRERRVGRRVNDAALYELISVIFELQRCETNGRNSGVNPQNNHAFSLSYARGCALL